MLFYDSTVVVMGLLARKGLEGRNKKAHDRRTMVDCGLTPQRGREGRRHRDIQKVNSELQNG
jgi:hypothetical protein